MRIRTIKPEFWESESLGRVSREARLLFIGLFSCCDDSGRTRASSRLLASRLYPYDEDAGRLLEGWLKELEAQDCIHHVRDWRMCLHPLSQAPRFWANAEDYACRTLKHVPETNFGKTKGQDEHPKQMELIP